MVDISIFSYLRFLLDYNRFDMRLFNVIFLASLLFLLSCNKYEDLSDLNFVTDQEFAIPLIDSKISILDVADQAGGNVSVRIDADGRVTVLYNGELVRNQASDVFPPVPGILPNILTDSVTNLKLPIPDKFEIRKAIFKKTNMFFRFDNVLNEAIIVTMKIPAMIRDGKAFEKVYLVPPAIIPIPYITPFENLEGYQLTSADNTIRFEYDARRPNGERIVFDYAEMRFDVIEFSYVEGYFSNETFEIEGDIINVGVFNKWLRGGMDFEDPKVRIDVENSFGFPVRSKFNKVRLTTFSGNEFDLVSDFIQSGVDFDYPRVNEIGVVKFGSFSFNKDNSNLREIFNDKTIRVSYDIDAVANPDADRSITNFVSQESYFSVNAAVELPLQGRANNFTLGDTFNLDLSDFDQFATAQFKSITTNDFPADIQIQAYFISGTDQVLDSLFASGPLKMSAANLSGTGKTTPGLPQTNFIDFDEVRFENLKNTKKVYAIVSLNNTSQTNQPLWIYDDYALGFKLGARFKLKQK